MENRKAFLTLRFWSIWRQTTFKSVHTFDCLMGNRGKIAGIQSCYSKIKLKNFSQINKFETHVWSEFKVTTHKILWISLVQKASERSMFQIMARSLWSYLTFSKKCFVVFLKNNCVFYYCKTKFKLINLRTYLAFNVCTILPLLPILHRELKLNNLFHIVERVECSRVVRMRLVAGGKIPRALLSLKHS